MSRKPVWSRYPKGNQFLLGTTRFFVAKPADHAAMLIFQKAGEDIVAVADFYTADAADSFITAMLDGIAELPEPQLEAVVESGRKVTAEQVGLGKGLAL